MLDKGFAKRLNSACDGHPHIPAFGQGRQTWIKEKLNISHEAVRKWFGGVSRPRPDKMRELAQALEVDEAWLALGITPDLEPRERRARNAMADGAVNIVLGFIQLNGGHCAFPDVNDPRGEYVDLYAINRGVQLSIHVSLAHGIAEDQYKFIIPKEYHDCKTVGVIHTRPNRVDLINMDHDTLERFTVRQGGYFETMVNYREGAYWSGSTKWKIIESFAKDL